MFIVFEGIDGSGTTTQVRLLTEFLTQKNTPVVQTAEPTDGIVGKFIRDVLSGQKKVSPRALQLLFFADREDHLQKKILPALHEKKVVVSDRYYVSTLAYSSLSDDASLFLDIAKYFPKPDLTIFIDIPVDIALERIKKRGEAEEIFEKKESLEKIAAAYRRLVSNIPEEKKLVLDGTKPISEVFHSIREKGMEKTKE